MESKTENNLSSQRQRTDCCLAETGGWSGCKMVKAVQRYKLPYKINVMHGDVIYSMVTIANTVLHICSLSTVAKRIVLTEEKNL